ncbi:MAG TPA: outer membrane beta-barrel protein [Bryobacteraceae bacterium]|nr:outer membrane beta-barrel protein [Bryobacteraceae bacterium]
MLRQILLAGALAGTALAQRAVDVRGTVGVAEFVDDSQTHKTFGGSARVYLTRRFAVEPEIQYMRLNSYHSDWLFMPNVSFDFRSLDKRVVPYAIGGVGYTRVTDGVFRSFTVDTWVAEGGAGVKLYLNPRVFVAPEFRIGSEVYARATISVGYTFGR